MSALSSKERIKMSTPMMPNEPGNRDWWKRPENRTTLIFYAIVAFLAIWFWGLIVPFLLAMLVDTVHMAILGGALFVTYLLLTSKKIRIMTRLINRWITGWFVNLDPIGIREDQIKETLKRKEKADEAIGSVRGLKDSLTKRFAANRAEYGLSMGRLKLAQTILADSGTAPERKTLAQRTMMKDGPYSASLEQLMGGQSKQLDHYEKAVAQLTRLSEFCDDVITRKQNEIRIEKDNQAEAKGLRTVRTAMSQIFGKSTGADQEMDDMAREQLEREYSEEMGQFDQFLAGMTDVIAKDDFNNLASLQDVQSRIDQYTATKAIPAAPTKIDIPQDSPQAVTIKQYSK